VWRLAKIDTGMSAEEARERVRRQLALVGGLYAVRERGDRAFQLRSVEGSWLWSGIYTIRIGSRKGGSRVSLWRRLHLLKHLHFCAGLGVILVWWTGCIVAACSQPIPLEALVIGVSLTPALFVFWGIQLWADSRQDGGLRRMIESALA